MMMAASDAFVVTQEAEEISLLCFESGHVPCVNVQRSKAAHGGSESRPQIKGQFHNDFIASGCQIFGFINVVLITSCM